MKIIDAHVHVSLDGKNGKGVPELIAAMDEAGIERAAVFAATIANLKTEAVLADIAPHPDRLFAIGAVSPIKREFQPSLRNVGKWLSDGTVRGLKFYTGYEHFYPADERLRPYLKLLERHGRPAIFHCGDLYDKIVGAKLKYAHPLAVDDLAAEMPDLKIVIAHLGSPWVLDAAQVCYKNRNVYADCSGFVYGRFSRDQRERFKRLWREFDELLEGRACEKILFGTDWPISDMRDYIEIVRSLADHDAKRVFADNASEVFGL